MRQLEVHKKPSKWITKAIINSGATKSHTRKDMRYNIPNDSAMNSIFVVNNVSIKYQFNKKS